MKEREKGTRRYKVDPSQESETEFIDVDLLLHLYVEQFKSIRLTQLDKFVRLFKNMIDSEDPAINIDKFMFDSRDYR
jgi:hypothetical protein